ncbi:HKD family nuclease [Wenyingzhuangia heitensis]|uniref:HKD family nuclease n=1 Tax=Wenyingzhuangia heitensis TaxID=1487859 RepID=A0ABX0UHD5_9FLAO|nr:phospholipase D family protein [Wenyingzhuangia heitensis]NIJ46427.1 HKD family nuclease [Wenyingzhuangia heitensis]
MKTTFLGHGLSSDKKNNVRKQLAESFESKKYKKIYGFVAFATLSGIKPLKSKLKIAKSNFEEIKFFIGINGNITSEEALEFLLNENIETYIYYDESIPEKIYHPKLFLFEGKEVSRIIIGSTNLTNRAINLNVEASIQLDLELDDLNTLTEIKDYYSSLLDLSSPNLKLLSYDYLEILKKRGLLSNGNNDEDNENDKDDHEIKKRYEYDKKFTENDKEKFDTLLDRYILYKKAKRPDGIVSKHAKDKELFRWYQKMHGLYNQETNSLPFECFERLLEAEFPFDGIGRENKRVIEWEKNFNKLVEHKNKVSPDTDYTYIPQFKNKYHPYYEIGRWCAWQKQRRKGNKNYGPLLTTHEEKRMKSINFIWDYDSKMYGRAKDDEWKDTLKELEKYYNIKINNKTVPSQKTYIGHWLSDQMSFKTKQDREGRNDLLSSEKEEMLGKLLIKNGVEWEWRKQKERESIESKIKSWQFVEKLKTEGTYKKFREENPKVIIKYNDDVAQLRSHTKRWNNEKNKWKFELVDKVGFPYSKE